MTDRVSGQLLKLYLQVRFVKNRGLLLWFWDDSFIVTMRLIPGFLIVDTR